MQRSPESKLPHAFASEFLSTETIFNELAIHLLKVEDSQYRNGIVSSRELKLLFLVGGDDQDLKSARDFTGNSIYTKTESNPFPKTPEVLEASASISSYFERLENEGVNSDQNSDVTDASQLAPSLSEIADIIWNLTHLTTLDPEFGKNYHYGINRIADCLGYTLKQILIMTYEKYNRRMTRGKDLNREAELIVHMIEKEIIPVPQKKQLAETYRIINEMSTKVLRRRLQEIQGNVIVY